MKVLPCDVAPKEFGGRQDDPTLQAALAEASLLQDELRYPHIVSCQDILFDADRSVVCLLLEYMDGGDLHALIEHHREADSSFDGHFPRRVLAAVGGALQYIHAVGILHRDVKPANVLLSRRDHTASNSPTSESPSWWKPPPSGRIRWWVRLTISPRSWSLVRCTGPPPTAGL
ncbi:unnamed protein product [Effrenium voratum]|uniref:non-specific serine/threonine protein kinase n=1 Tax=Effrenium voratum TaxID=2562239 RepID=A0AA36N330_9DINO|nr:unnamed protein product [Effrenium voratum]